MKPKPEGMVPDMLKGRYLLLKFPVCVQKMDFFSSNFVCLCVETTGNCYREFVFPHWPGQGGGAVEEGVNGPGNGGGIFKCYYVIVKEQSFFQK